MLQSAEIDRIVKRIVDFSHPEKVTIFGSYAKGNAMLSSDLDILVVKDTAFPMANRTADLAALFAQSLVAVDIHLYTPEEMEEFGQEPYSFIACVLKYGKIVFECQVPDDSAC